MSDGLTGPVQGPGQGSDPSRPAGAALVRALAVVVGLAAAGAIAGALWEALWQPPTGVVYGERWFLDPAGPDVSFSGTALYVLIAGPLGFATGCLAGLLSRHEAVTLGAVLVGSLLGGWLMYTVGHALGPPDPRVLAAQEADFTRVPGDLVLVAPDDPAAPYGSTALVAFPLGALAGLGLVYLSGFRSRPHG